MQTHGSMFQEEMRQAKAIYFNMIWALGFPQIARGAVLYLKLRQERQDGSVG